MWAVPSTVKSLFRRDKFLLIPRMLVADSRLVARLAYSVTFPTIKESSFLAILTLMTSHL